MRKFEVSGMSCAACSARVERAVSAVSGVESCAVNLLSGVMTVEGKASSESIISAVAAAGYGAREKIKTQENVNNNSQNRRKSTLIRLIASIILLLPLMYITMGHLMLSAPLPAPLSSNATAIAIIEGSLSLAILIINYKFFKNGALGAIRLAPNMDTLVALGSGASFIYSSVILAEMLLSPKGAELHGYLHGLYYESAAMIVTLITVGKLLEERAKGKTTDAVRSLMSLAPKMATVERDGALVAIPAEELSVGDIFILKPGDSVPCDGVVIEGESSINESALTGESIPLDKTVGDRVLAATVNQSGYLRCQAEKVGEDTAISAVIRLVEDASATKAPIARAADRVAGVFVPLVLLISLITLGVWLAVNGDIGHALGRCISVLVISCPCALGLATPVAITVGTGVGARCGILYKSAEAIELAGKAGIVVLDKTGTVTEGKPAVTDIVAYTSGKDRLLSLALSLEAKSEHPLAGAVSEYAEALGVQKYECSEFAAIAGAGVRGVIGGREVLGVSYPYAEKNYILPDRVKADFERLSAEVKTPLIFIEEGECIGVIAVSDKPREDSTSAIAELERLGMRVVMLTGDNKRCAEAIAAQVGIGEVYAEMLPDGKAEVVRKLSSEGGVIMVGDGINDAPSLALADVGAAIGGGTDIAIESADLVLMRDKLSDVPRAVRLGRAVLKNIRENLFWAFIYNTLGIPLAAGAFSALLDWEMSPMIGALAMSLSSFCVVMNALRLNFFSRREKREGLKHAACPISIEKNENGGGCAPERKDEMETVILVEGMMCPHCEARVKQAIEAIEGVSSAEVSHVSGEAKVAMSAGCSADSILAAISAAGYPCKIKD